MSAVLTPSASRYHRRALGLTQSGLAKAAGVSTSYIKQFESERLRPSQDFINHLTGYFTSQGITPEKLGAVYSVSGKIDTAPTAKPGRLSGMASVPQIQVSERQCFYISSDIPDAIAEELLTRWDQNEDRIAELFAKRVTSGLFTRYSEDAETLLQEVFALLAENFVIFRLLTGWQILEDADAVKADTVAACILTHYADVIEAKKKVLNETQVVNPKVHEDESLGAAE